MPQAPLRPCAYPGCPVMGPCPIHQRQQDQGRGTAQQRGYTYRWNQYSHRFLARHPLCGERADGTLDPVHSRCVRDGLTTPAQCVDHVVPLRAGGSLWDETNHMSACIACNTWKTRNLE